MSSADPPVSAATGAGLGYGIAIAVSILVLISTIMLASYACVRVKINGSSNSYRDDADGYVTNSRIPAANTVEPVVVVVGLEKPVVESYPKMMLGESRRLPKPNTGPCAICLSDYQPKDTLRCIPDCHHCFHADCVDEWLEMSGTCPLCRNSPAPSTGTTPVATPLSDLVPLAFHTSSSALVRQSLWVRVLAQGLFRGGIWSLL